MSRSAANSVARRRWRVYVSSGRAGAGFHSCARVCGHRWPASTCSYRCSCGVMGLRRKREPRFFSRPSPSRGPWVSTLGGRVRDEAYGITDGAFRGNERLPAHARCDTLPGCVLLRPEFRCEKAGSKISTCRFALSPFSLVGHRNFLRAKGPRG